MFLHLKIKAAFLYPVVLACIFIAFTQEAIGQRARHIKVNAANANLYRDSLKRVVFGTPDFPYDILPDSVITNVSSYAYYTGSPYSTIMYPAGNLDSIDKFSVKLSDDLADFPQQVPVYVFHPHNNNGKLFIYHSGHCAGSAVVEDILGNGAGSEPGIVIPAMLNEGYTVLAVPMLYYQFIAPEGLSCGFDGHSNLFFDGHYANPLGLFFKPLISSLNQLGRSNYSSIYMCGLSGGGWTTSIYPAMDSSISCSFPVAGSWPLPLANLFNGGGDYEQAYPPLFIGLLDYHELYTLSCLAPARKMLQINNRYDACCFNGSEAHLYYVDSVAKALEGTNGEFKFYLDETQTGHQVSPRAMQVIFTYLRNERASLQAPPVDSVVSGSLYSYSIRNNFTLNTSSDNSVLQYSLLKAPSWLLLDPATGRIGGVVPDQNLISKPDTISFKVEDQFGRFVVHNYILVKERTHPYFFTKFNDNSTVYMLPGYAGSLSAVAPGITGSFYFNNPLLSVINISVDNNSIIKLKLNAPVTEADSIGYSGFSQPNAITYSNGSRLDNIVLTKINLNAVFQNYATAGMIRFNTDTRKFEYFNGISWINLN